MKQVKFSLRQTNGTFAEISIGNVNQDIKQDDFCGKYLFPAILRLVKGSSKTFDKNLPIELHIEAIAENDNVVGKFLASTTIKSGSAYAARRAALAFNESIAALALPNGEYNVYQLVDMKGNKGADFRNYAKTFLRPSVSMQKALVN